MPDATDPKRSRNMAAIRHKDTQPELSVRHELWERGLKGYRLHDKNLPGKPDLRFSRFNAVIFVHGCYWHRHPGCAFATTPKRNADFWTQKLNRNAERDQEHLRQLRSMGWRIATIWECALSCRDQLPIDPIDQLVDWLTNENTEIVIPSGPPRVRSI